MTYLNILEAFETEIHEIDNAITKPSTDDSLYWLNQAVAKFCKERFNGDFIHRTSYEQNEKRRNDLIRLYEVKTYNTEDNEDVIIKNINPSYDEYVLKYPKDFMYSLNEDVIISNNHGDNPKNTSIFECTSDSFMYRVNNSLTDFHYSMGTARPIRIRTADGCKLLTDKNYYIQEYTLGYLRYPKEIELSNPFMEYTDFDNITMPEIIKIAAQMYLENTSNERYKTISQEVSTQE